VRNYQQWFIIWAMLGQVMIAVANDKFFGFWFFEIIWHYL
jgi:hypothetical protein